MLQLHKTDRHKQPAGLCICALLQSVQLNASTTIVKYTTYVRSGFRISLSLFCIFLSFCLSPQSAFGSRIIITYSDTQARKQLADVSSFTLCTVFEGQPRSSTRGESRHTYVRSICITATLPDLHLYTLYIVDI